MNQTQTESPAGSPRESPPPYRIIFNWDGTAHGFSEYPQSIDQLLGMAYAPLEGSQIGALFWCIGEDEAKWPSENIPVIGDAEGCHYGSVKSMRRAEGIRAMFERGEDLYGEMVKRGHDAGVHVYCSIRMNDNHFWSDPTRSEQPLAPEDMAKTVRPGLSQMRKDHPEWVLGVGNAPRWAATSWNMAIPEVKEYKLKHITEACQQADWDGVEIDWQRHAFHLPEHDAYRLRYTLTDLQRAVRRMTDQIARERGKPFHVAVRVGASLETCRRIGYDVETWIKEGLCDTIATNANSGTDPGVEVEEYVKLVDGTGIKLYPGFDSHGVSGQGHLIPSGQWLEGWYSGLAKSYYDRGAEGIHIFNWHRLHRARRSLLATIGSPETLKRKNKVYTSVVRHIRARSEIRYGAERDDRLLGEVPVTLYHTLTGDGPRFHIRVHDDVVEEAEAGALKSAELQVELEHFSPHDQVEVTLDGEVLGQPAVRNVAAEDPNEIADVDENTWLVWQLKPKQADRGTHEVQVVLIERNPRIRAPIVVRYVEIWVNYK